MNPVDLQACARELVRSIVQATAEHGAPNTFGFKELCIEYDAPSPFTAEMAAAKFPELLSDVNARYENGRIIVGEKQQ